MSQRKSLRQGAKIGDDPYRRGEAERMLRVAGEDSYVVPRLDQRSDQPAPDKAGAAGNQHRLTD